VPETPNSSAPAGSRPLVPLLLLSAAVRPWSGAEGALLPPTANPTEHVHAVDRLVAETGAVNEDASQPVERTLVVDGNNVMGSRPDGWWRDRQGAARRLLERLQCYRRTVDDPVVVVFDVPHPDLPEGDHEGVTVLYASRRGRNAADQRILELLDAEAGAGAEIPPGVVRSDRRIEVVTSDRALADGARQRGAEVTGAGALLSLLDQAGC
jgi:predicted RNA-binding protein with PIN domain